MIRDFGRQFEKNRLVLEGSAGEAACWGKERVGVVLMESIQFRIQHAALKVAADVWATASSADLRFWVRVSGFSDCECGVLDCGVVVLCFVSLGSVGLSR